MRKVIFYWNYQNYVRYKLQLSFFNLKAGRIEENKLDKLEGHEKNVTICIGALRVSKKKNKKIK